MNVFLSFSAVVMKWGLYLVIRVCECSLMDRFYPCGGMAGQLVSYYWDKTHGQEQLKERIVQNCKARVLKVHLMC